VSVEFITADCIEWMKDQPADRLSRSRAVHVFGPTPEVFAECFIFRRNRVLATHRHIRLPESRRDEHATANARDRHRTIPDRLIDRVPVNLFYSGCFLCGHQLVIVPEHKPVAPATQPCVSHALGELQKKLSLWAFDLQVRKDGVDGPDCSTMCYLPTVHGPASLFCGRVKAEIPAEYLVTQRYRLFFCLSHLNDTRVRPAILSSASLN